MSEYICTESLLNENPQYIFVFGDNLEHRGYGGAAILRDHPQTYGFITKKSPNNLDSSFYKPEEYKYVFEKELEKLERLVHIHTDKIYLISKIGSGLANKYNIWEKVIETPLINFIAKNSNVTRFFEI